MRLHGSSFSGLNAAWTMGQRPELLGDRIASSSATSPGAGPYVAVVASLDGVAPILPRSAAPHIPETTEVRESKTTPPISVGLRSDERGDQARPWRTAKVATAVRESSPSLLRMPATWVSTVRRP